MLPMLALLGMPLDPVIKSDGLRGYINASLETPPPDYGYGVSLYSSAWPLLKSPVAGFQIGLASTWILPDNRSVKEPLVPKGTVARDSMPERGPSFWTVFQTIEGGLGFWTSNRFFSPTAKFRMNGSVDGYNHEVSTPGWDFYGNPLPAEYMGIVQLSSRVLFPPDGLTLKPDTCGELFGYAWMALPLLPSRETPVKTGNQCWTAFFNAANFRGPVAFYLPTAWSKMSQNHPPAVGRGLDALPGIADSGAIEIGSVPRFESVDGPSTTYSRIPSLQFPVDAAGNTPLFHNFTVYSKSALWNDVESWVQGSAPAKGIFNAKGAYLPKVTANPLVVQQGSEIQGVGKWVATAALDDHTFGLTWQKDGLSPWKPGVRKGEFPSYFRKTGGVVEAVPEREVPDRTGLPSANFAPPSRDGSYVPSEGGKGVWMNPGPKAGPFRANLTDGSVVTYYWYRFVDQPSLQSAGLSSETKARLQRLVETMHANWTPDKAYMAPPSRGRLASIDTALLVKPPKWLEKGYVPVAIRQDPQ
jgi:hypothetical protein